MKPTNGVMGFLMCIANLFGRSAPPDINGGEDFAFVAKARSLGKKLASVPDFKHLVLHTMHAKSMSRIFPQYQCPTSMLDKNAEPWLLKAKVPIIQYDPFPRHGVDEFHLGVLKSKGGFSVVGSHICHRPQSDGRSQELGRI